MAHLTSENSSQGTTDSSSADLEKSMAHLRTEDSKEGMTDSSSADLEKSTSASGGNRTLKDQVLDVFHRLKELLTSDDFEPNLRIELEKSNPEYIKNIERRMKDMAKCDHGIVIAGETSAGKSTLINRILGKPIFTARIMESTSTICKIRNLEGLKIIIESKTGEKKELDLTDKCNLETREGMIKLRETLAKHTEITLSRESMQYRSVDIGFPIPMLKGNTILVDTPGIGPDEEITQKLMEYLPNAVSLIFVINVANAGGMQNDRLPEILRQVRFQMLDEMPCLDPEDTIFITNKWDTIKTEVDDFDFDFGDESDKERTWHEVKSLIQDRWPAAKDENIFKLSLSEVSKKGENLSSQEFQKFRKKLEVNINKAQDIRVLRHLSFLQGLFWTVQGGLNARLKFNELETGLQVSILCVQQQLINNLVEGNEEAHANLHKKITSTIEDTVTECYTYMTSEEGKELILNPPGMVPVIKDSWNPTQFDKKVYDRVCLYLKKFLKSRDVQRKFLDIQEELNSYTKQACLQLSEFETKWLGLGKSLLKDFFAVRDFSRVKGFVKMLQDDEFQGFEMPIGILFNIGFAVTAFAFLPISVPVMLLLDRESRKKKIIEEEYTKLMSSFRDDIRNHLNSTCGKLLRQMVNTVTENFLPRRIDHLTELVRQLVTYREENQQKRDLFLRLQEQIKRIEESAANIQGDLLKLD